MKNLFNDNVCVELEETADGFLGRVNSREHTFKVVNMGDAIHIVTSAGESCVVHLAQVNESWHVAIDGAHYEIAEVQKARRRAGASPSAALEAPMPGTVLEVRVKSGDSVAVGQVLMVVEAMKMEHAILSPRDGTVARVCFNEGDAVGQGDQLVELT